MIYGGCLMAHHDLMGLENFIEYARLSWVEMSPWWGIGSVILGSLMLKTASGLAEKGE